MSTATGRAHHKWDSTRPSPKAVKAALAKGDMEALYFALTPRQRLFAKEYIVDFVGSLAAIRAGYSPKYANKQAHILLQHSGVARYIEHLQMSLGAKAIAINPDWVLQKTVSTINTAEDAKQHSAVLRGLELLARHFGMLKDKQEISGPDGEAIRIKQEETQRDADKMKEMIEALTTRTFIISDKDD